ncbi:hypothetical protein P7K49_027512 [Saguinus oedipus]|uniref:Uncharacterized protein n=1 Tax=Saguinus oedipus TaxID=9490 RepID=A0ABQ9UAD2_SAGOE|nr:hypothetical protein P7K49_027512 [Saguinus oedipus]
MLEGGPGTLESREELTLPGEVSVGTCVGLGDPGRCGALDSRAAPTRPRRPRPGAAPRTFCSRSMQPGARRPGHSQSPARGGCWALCARGHEISRRVPPGWRVLIPRRRLSRLPGEGRGRCRGGVSLRGLRGRPLSRQPGPARRRRPIRLDPENARVDGRRPRDGWRLFLSHCSRAPEEMTAGVNGLPGRRPLRPCSAAPALPPWPDLACGSGSGPPFPAAGPTPSRGTVLAATSRRSPRKG